MKQSKIVDLVAAVRQAAAEAPDTVVLQCLYFSESEGKLDYTAPICIIGKALSMLGKKMSKQVVTPLFNGQNLRVVVDSWDDSSESMIEWLAYVQCAQDMHMTWSDSVAKADSEVVDK